MFTVDELALLIDALEALKGQLPLEVIAEQAAVEAKGGSPMETSPQKIREMARTRVEDCTILQARLIQMRRELETSMMAMKVD